MIKGVCVVAAACVAGAGVAQTVDVMLPGVTSFDGWEELTVVNFSSADYGTFPGLSPWAAPIGSNVAGSGDAELSKVGGAGYPAARGIYHGGFSLEPNSFGGSLQISDSTVVADLETVVLQVQIGQAFGFDFFNGALPVLGYNAGGQALAGQSAVVNSFVDGTFNVPGAGPQPLLINTYLIQWDLRGIGESISSIELDWSTVMHAQTIALRLDQSDTYANVVPAPGAAAVLLGAAGLVRRRR